MRYCFVHQFFDNQCMKVTAPASSFHWRVLQVAEFWNLRTVLKPLWAGHISVRCLRTSFLRNLVYLLCLPHAMGVCQSLPDVWLPCRRRIHLALLSLGSLCSLCFSSASAPCLWLLDRVCGLGFIMSSVQILAIWKTKFGISDAFFFFLIVFELSLCWGNKCYCINGWDKTGYKEMHHISKYNHIMFL